MFQNNAQQPIGGNVQQPSLFGNTTTPGNLFGQPQQTTLNTNPLGQQQQQGVLGQQPQQQTSIFGNPQPQIGGLQTTQQQTGLLGQTSTLGQTPQQGQQLPLQQQTGILGQNTTGILGQSNAGILGGQSNPLSLGSGLQAPILGQTQGQPNQVQQPQQQQQPKNYTVQQMKNEAQKHIDNLAKTIINKEKIEKNQKNLQLIEKNSLKNIQQQQQQPQQNNQGMGLGLGLVSQQQQQQQRPVQKVDPRNHTAKVEKFYNEWNKVIQRITQKQAETLNQLNELNQLLKQQDMYNDIDEESLIDSIRQLGKDLDGLEHKIIEVVKLQEKVLGLEKEETEWDQIVNNLSECLILLEQQARDVEDQLSQAENHPKVLNR